MAAQGSKKTKKLPEMNEKERINYYKGKLKSHKKTVKRLEQRIKSLEKQVENLKSGVSKIIPKSKVLSKEETRKKFAKIYGSMKHDEDRSKT